MSDQPTVTSVRLSSKNVSYNFNFRVLHSEEGSDEFVVVEAFHFDFLDGEDDGWYWSVHKAAQSTGDVSSKGPTLGHGREEPSMDQAVARGRDWLVDNGYRILQ
jgi:hypothetical protein